MLPTWRPDSVEHRGVFWPVPRKRKKMCITAVYIQLPDFRNIVFQRASGHGYPNFPGVRRKNGIARHHMVSVPDFLYVLSVGVTHIDRFFFIKCNQLPVWGITCAARRDISQPLRRTSQDRHRPYGSTLCFVVQIAPQQQKLRAIRGNIQDAHVADRGAERRRGSPLHGHFDGIVSADEINSRSVGEDRGRFGFARKGKLLHRQRSRIGGCAAPSKRKPQPRPQSRSTSSPSLSLQALPAIQSATVPSPSSSAGANPPSIHAPSDNDLPDPSPVSSLRFAGVLRAFRDSARESGLALCAESCR